MIVIQQLVSAALLKALVLVLLKALALTLLATLVLTFVYLVIVCISSLRGFRRKPWQSQEAFLITA